MNITSFHDLLTAARTQGEPQSLLFVFAAAELADDSTPQQRRHFELGEGGALVPVMAVAKGPDELRDFAQLAAESQAFGKPWTIVFAAALSGRAGQAPLEKDVSLALDRMTEAIRAGTLAAFIPFDQNGDTVVLR